MFNSNNFIKRFNIIGLVIGLCLSPLALSADKYEGYNACWLNETGDAAITVQQCGKRLCASIAWLQRPLDNQGLSRSDTRNPKASLRNRPLMDLALFANFKWRSRMWRDGHMYNPRNGRTYRGNATLIDGGKLKLRGCAGNLCSTEYWVQTDSTYCASSTGPAT